MKKTPHRQTTLCVALLLMTAACDQSPTSPRVTFTGERPAAETIVMVSHTTYSAGDLVSVQIRYSRGLHEDERLRARVDWDPTRFELVDVTGEEELLSANHGAGYAYLMDGGAGRIELEFRALTAGSAEGAFHAEALVLGGEDNEEDIIQ